MRIYMDGTIDRGFMEQARLLPTDIYFASQNCDDNLSPGTDCLCLSGLECECAPVGKRGWTSRWKGVEAECEKAYGEKNITAKDILQLICDRQLTLSNMSAYIDCGKHKEVNVKVTGISIQDYSPIIGDIEINLEGAGFNENISFVNEGMLWDVKDRSDPGPVRSVGKERDLRKRKAENYRTEEYGWKESSKK